jgi:hypothetical protein
MGLNTPFHETEKFTRLCGKHCPENEKPADTAGLRQTLPLQENLERAKGFEPSTPTLARSCSTTELHPHPRDWRRTIASNGQSYAKCGLRMQQSVRDPESAEYRGIDGNWPKSAVPPPKSPPILINHVFRPWPGTKPPNARRRDSSLFRTNPSRGPAGSSRKATAHPDLRRTMGAPEPIEISAQTAIW